MFGAICECCGYDWKVLSNDKRGQVNQTGKILREAGYTVDDLRTFMETVWAKDWRYYKNQQLPTPSQIREEIGKLHSAVLENIQPARPRNKGDDMIDSVKRVAQRMIEDGTLSSGGEAVRSVSEHADDRPHYRGLLAAPPALRRASAGSSD
jgi:hypothetical protein